MTSLDHIDQARERDAVEAALRHPVWADASDAEIAEFCGVPATRVRQTRTRLQREVEAGGIFARAAEDRGLWIEGAPFATDPAAQDWLRARRIEPELVDADRLARVAGKGLVLPLYDARGIARSLVEHDLTLDAPVPSAARADLVLACGRARELLAEPRPCRLILCVGAVRFLELATTRSDGDESGVLGVARWSAALAQRIPDGSELVLATGVDPSGEKLAAEVVDSLRGRRVRLARWRPREGDASPGLAGGDVSAIDPHGWRTPVERALALGAFGADALPSPFPALDTATRGGLRPGKLVILAGAPGAGKTSLAVQLARHFARAGCPVGLLASDEAADGLLVRWGQQEGLTRDNLEQGIHAARRYLANALAGVPLILVDADEDAARLEDVADRVSALARDRGRPGVLVVDSIQTARVAAHQAEARSPRERVEATVSALKRAHRGAGLLVIATCEVSRGLYRGGADPKINPLAAGKESGSIEYAAEMLLVLTSVTGESDLVDVTIAKNRIGGGHEPFRLKLDRDRARFDETSLDPPDDEHDQDELDDARAARLEADAEKLLAEVVKARARGAELKSRHDVRALARGKQAYRAELVALLFATGRLVGGRGTAIGPPSHRPPTNDPAPPPEDDG